MIVWVNGIEYAPRINQPKGATMSMEETIAELEAKVERLERALCAFVGGILHTGNIGIEAKLLDIELAAGDTKNVLNGLEG